jgi:hypothetical protein
VPLGEVGGEVGREVGGSGGVSASLDPLLEPGASGARARPTWRDAYARVVTISFCDDRGELGFSWIVDEPMSRTSHALAADERVWLVDPVRFPAAIERAEQLGTPAAVIQLLDRHNRDCASLAAELGVPHHVVPASLPDTPFGCVPVRDSSRWREVALWWPAERTLVVAEALGTNQFFTSGRDAAGVHLVLRLSPPREVLGHFEPEHLLVGHGTGLHGPVATEALRTALARSRSGLPQLVLKAPALAVDAIRRRRR